MSSKNNNLHEWFRENLWAFIIVSAGAIITFAILQQRVSALEAKVAQYPSQDWFELKFDIIDERLESIETKLE